MFTNPLNVDEAEKLLNVLKETDGKLLLKEDMSALRQIFCETGHPGLRDAIAVTLVDAEDEDFYPFLIDKIKEVIHTKYVSNLLFAAWHYNCADDIQLFVDVIILKSDLCLGFAIGIIEAMEEINPLEKKYAINKLTAYLITLGEENKKYNNVSHIHNFLQMQ